MEGLELEYLDWIKNLINPDRLPYDCLIEHLYNINYVTVKDDDNNRAIDGTDLRYTFCYEKGYSSSDSYFIVNDIFANKPCSVLEMMTALARKMDENIMWNGYRRVHIWFFDMLANMNIDDMTDNNYNSGYIDIAVNAMMYYNIEYNGKGGLFVSPYNDVDMRELSIWYQMQQYIADKE